jgi:hypothetical protein
MIIIAHRGNINGPNETNENTLEQIKLCLDNGYDCEIDLWLVNGQLFLGHDNPQYEVSLNFILLNAPKLWCHCKHLDSFELLLKVKEINCFYHNTDDYVLTSHGYIWSYPGTKVPKERGIVVMPEWNPEIKYDRGICGICTDYPSDVGKFLK